MPKRLSLLTGILLLIAFLVGIAGQQSVRAEIATQQDWIGLYPVATLPPSGTPTAPDYWNTYDVAGRNLPISWRYTGDTDTANPCPVSPKSIKPWLAGSCRNSTFVVPSTAGAYEFRLYANNTLYLLNVSGIFWSGPFNATIDATVTNCTQPANTPYINLSWGATKGVNGTNIYRNPPNGSPPSGAPYQVIAPGTTTYQDTNITKGVSYTYTVAAFTNRDPLNQLAATFPGGATQSTVIAPWCDAIAPTAVLTAFSSTCYDPTKWGAAGQKINVIATDNAGGTGVASVTVRIVKTTAPGSSTDYPTTLVSGSPLSGTWQTVATINYPGGAGRYDEFQVWLLAVDSAGNPSPPVYTQQPAFGLDASAGTYFYTQPSCAKPFLKTSQGAVHSNEGKIDVPSPAP